ncbi:MAG: methyltransferase domain-containing protein [Burkholderiales bacterium]|jgi:SAM-dependent methyltransferase|nr:methyltransferase domain-containing protein [Burkholderiales bacterium]
MATYQSHEASATSVSDTQRKLGRLMLPDDLTGKRVLDVGCNEGFFSALARERGASEVIGIDFVKENIDFARERYADRGVQFRHQSWGSLPEGPFDLVLWTSAMHYELDPRSVANAICDRLAPDGLFVLECGVIMQPGKEFVPVPRIADTRWYPSRDFLVDEILSRFSVRQVAQPEIAQGDFVPRSVFHCKKALPIVLLIRGQTGTGKSTVAERLKNSATKSISLDVFVSRMGTNRHPHNDFEKFVIEHYDPANLSKIYSGIDSANYTKQYVELLAAGIAKTDEVVIFEGFMTDAQCTAVANTLNGKAIVWDMQRSK